MTADIESFALDNRLGTGQPRKNVQSPALTALQGATVAFAAANSTKGTPKGNTKKMASSPLLNTRRSSPSPEAPESEIPEKGFVLDKIRAFSGSTDPSSPALQSLKEPGSPSNLRLQTPQTLAATRATERSTLPSKSRSISPQKSGTSTSSRPSERPVVPRKPTIKSTLDRPNDKRPAPPPARGSSRKANVTGTVEAEKVYPDQEAPHSDRITAEEKGSDISTRTVSTDPAPRTKFSQTPQGNTISRKKAPASQIVDQAKQTPITLDASKPQLPPRPTLPNSDGRLAIPIPKARQDPVKSYVSDSSSVPSSQHPSTPDLVSLPTRIRRATAGTSDSYTLDEEELANAIVASSLASSRAPSPRRAPPPLPPHRRSRSRSLLRPGSGHRVEKSRTPSPQKALRQTLRDHSTPDAEEDDASHVGRKHYIRSHPHKHHEGDRKRWRKEITERERKRYEGVWAANKGLWITPEIVPDRVFAESGNLSDMVLNLVVQDIWSRSRLPTHILEQIWNLVDRRGIGLLSREEFVVGMWLIDQQLKGHKLPVKVPDSVWESVRHVAGLKVPSDF